MLRWNIFLNAYNYDLLYKPGKDIAHADAFSSLPVQLSNTSEEKEVVLMIEMLDTPIIQASDISKGTKKDKILSRVSHWALKG